MRASHLGLLLLVVAMLAGCSAAGRDRLAFPSYETDIELEQANFEVHSVHHVGRSEARYLLFFWIGGSGQLQTDAWTELKSKADVEGKAAQYINVTSEQATTGGVWPFYWRETLTVSADVIVFK